MLACCIDSCAIPRLPFSLVTINYPDGLTVWGEAAHGTVLTKPFASIFCWTAASHVLGREQGSGGVCACTACVEVIGVDGVVMEDLALAIYEKDGPGCGFIWQDNSNLCEGQVRDHR